MPADEQTLALGTLFTGRMDASYMQIVRRLRTLLTQLDKSMKDVGRQVEQSTKAFKNSGSELSTYSLAAGKAVEETSKYRKALADMTAMHGRSGTALNEQIKKLNTAERAIQNHAETIRRNGNYTQAAVAKARNYVNAVDRMGVVNQKARGLIKYTNSGIEVQGRSFKQTAQTVASSTRAHQRSIPVVQSSTKAHHLLGKQLSRVEGGIERVRAAFKVTASYGVAASAIYTVVSALRVGRDEIVDFDQALKNLQAITGATDAQIAAMAETLKDVARDTKFSTTEIAGGMVLLGQTGLSAEESLDAIRAVANLATGTLSKMDVTADLLTTTLRAFNLEAIQADRVADVMANAINKSKLTVDKLRIAFNFVGASASQAGLSVEQSAGAMMTLANSGLRASTIGTGFRQVLARLISPNQKLRAAFEAQGIALNKISPTVVGFEQSIENLAKAVVNADGRTVDMSKAFELFGLRGAQAAAVLVKGFISGEFQEMLNSVYEVGTAAEMAGIQAEGLGVKIKNLADRAKLLALALGGAGVKGILEGVVDVLRVLVTLLEKAVSGSIGSFIVQAGAYSVAVFGMAKALKALHALLIGGAIVGGLKKIAVAMGLV